MRRRATVAVTLLALAGATGCPSLDGISGAPEKDAALPRQDGSPPDQPDARADAPSPAEDSGPIAQCDRPEGGLVCTPGRVTCGDTTCPLPSVCCMANGSTQETCTTAAACSSPSFSGACDETADCAPGQVCCVAFDALRVQTGATCAATCALGVQSCRANSECTSGTACKVQRCFGHTVQLCGDLGAICR